jgi:hypothetical protein
MTTQLDHLNEIKSLFAELAAGRQEYDFQPPAMVSHAEQYAAQPERLRTYAKQVVCGRIMIFLAFSRMNTQALLQTYLLGVDSNNPFPLLLAARSQLELFSVVADTTRMIKENSGEHQEDFSLRVRTVDEALINATFGTRSSVLKELLPKIELSRLRPVTQKDYDVVTSKNVLTRLEKLSKSGVYPECKNDYERLCEYVHPNYGMNMLHVVASPINIKLLRFSLTSQEPFERALSASASVMVRAARGTLAVMDELQPPFGMGTVSYIT